MTRYATAVKDMTDALVNHGWKGEKLTGSGGTGGDNVVTGYISSTGKKLTRTYPCHNPIHAFTDAEILWSGFGYRTSREVAWFFHSWLINDSPWAKAGVVPQDLSPQFMFQSGFVFDGLQNTPANLLHNFLIASRMVAEWPALIDTWYTLVTQYDIKPALAFLMLTVFNPYKNRLFLKTPGCLATKDKYDWPLDMGRATEEYVLNFLKNKPVGQSDYPFSPSAKTAPVNTLWGNLVDNKDPLSYVSVLKKLYGQMSTSIEQESLLTHLKASYQVFSPEDILEIIKQEQVRLKA